MTHVEDIGVITAIDPAGDTVYLEIACQGRETPPEQVDPTYVTPDRIPIVRNPIKYTSWNQKIDGNIHHTVFIKDGAIYWMGGTGGQRKSMTPTLVKEGNFIQIASTLNGFIALDAGGNLWLSEDGYNIQQDTEVDGVINIAAGDGFYAILTSGGQVRVKGSNEYGQHGRGSVGGNNAGKWGEPAHLPAGATPIQVAAGGYKIGIVTTNGEVYMWGKISPFGQGTPQLITDVSSVQRLEIGDEGNIAITPNQIVAWDIPQVVVPAGRISLNVGDRGFNKVIFKNRVIYALREDGLVFSSGDNNNFGQLGLGFAAGGTKLGDFYLVKTGTARMTDIGAGRNTGYAFDSFGNLWSWGQNTEGQLGLGFSGQGNNYHPVKVK
ncbi:MAG: hypothetical protein GX219_03800 [Tissierellia bacterium]|nr:hypothetical protein [Tissierellia bacterium]